MAHTPVNACFQKVPYSAKALGLVSYRMIVTGANALCKYVALLYMKILFCSSYVIFKQKENANQTFYYEVRHPAMLITKRRYPNSIYHLEDLDSGDRNIS